MPILTFRSPVEVPLLRKGTPKPVPPDPRAHDTFRVSQQFDDPDAYWRLTHPDRPISEAPKHRATDIGNFRCGDPIVAMAPGTVIWVGADSAGALGVRLDHGYGITSEYWHLDRQDVRAGQTVVAGHRIGIVGDTGLGSVCHCHIEVKRSGVRIDPEPLMFGSFLVVMEDDVLGLKTTFLDKPFRARTADRVAIRSDTRIAEETEITRVSGYEATVIGTAQGDSFDGSTEWWVYGVHNRGLVCFHSAAATRLPAESGCTDAQLAAAAAAGHADGVKVGFVDAKTKAVVAVQGIKP